MSAVAIVPSPARPPVLSEPGTVILDGPTREGSELSWTVRRRDGSTNVVAMLLPELSRVEAVRRRWVADVERVRRLSAPGVLRIVEIGNAGHAGDVPPWRIREHLDGAESLEHWLERRAPLPVDEGAAMIAALASIVNRIHRGGVVLRDLHPRRTLIDVDGTPVLADVGLTRVDVLSSRTAASLILEGSPYAAPEQFARNAVDGRSDVYGLGVLLFRALTGQLPFGDEPAILRPPGAPPSARAVRPVVSERLDAFLSRCLADDPLARPDSAETIARFLRGEAADEGDRIANVACQHCMRPLRPGQRLCTHCGRQAVRFAHAPADADETFDLVLTKINEDAATRQALRAELNLVGNRELPPLNLLTGDARMYSKAEQKRLLGLPLTLLSKLDESTATALQSRLAETKGLSVRVRKSQTTSIGRRGKVAIGAIGAAGVVMSLAFVAAGSVGAALVAVFVALLVMITLARRLARKRDNDRVPLLALRAAPAALPASDPWVARLSALLDDDAPDDVRDQVGVLALALQRLVDHTAEHAGEKEQIAAIADPVAQLVPLVEAQVRRIAEIDAELPTLDEGTIVRRLAGLADQDDAERDALLGALDRLRSLEDARAAAFHRLLEAGALIRRSVAVGLSVRDDEVTRAHDVAQALALLGEG